MISTPKQGVILVDHGSRREQSNRLVEDLAVSMRDEGSIVEPAHMELAEPSIATAFSRCVEQGAGLVLIHPYFLGPGRHWSEDIPRLAAAASRDHAGVEYLVTAPLGPHHLLSVIVRERLEYCLRQAREGAPPCEVCRDDEPCVIRRGDAHC